MNLSKECFTTRQILNKSEPILKVIHDEDGDWQFLSEAEINVHDAAMVSLGQVIEIDKSVSSVISIPINHFAKRSRKDEQWIIKKL